MISKYTIFEANNGKEALDLCNSQDIDLVILDYEMPILDGIQTTKKLRKLRINVPIIGYTGYTDY